MYIAVWYNLPSGGAKRALFDYVQGLVARGHRIDVWCPSSADTTHLPLSSLAPEHVLPIEVAPPQGLQARLFPYAEAGALRRLRAMHRHAQEFGAAIAGKGYDVLFAHSCQWFATPMVGRYVSLPKLLYLPEPYRPLYEARPVLPWIAEPDSPHPWWHPNSLRQWFGSAARVNAIRVQAREELVSIRAFDRVLVHSRFTREALRAVFNVDAKVSYLGVDADRFPYRAGPREPFVISVGEFSPHKNPLFIIEVIGATRRKPPLVWVANRGDEEMLRQGHALAARLGVSLTVKSAVTEAELVDLYQRATVFAYAPSLEPFGLAPLEANSCGTPVVARAEGGVRETILDGENGLIGDYAPEEMAEAIDALFDDPSTAERLGRQGAERVRTLWTSQAAIDRLEGHLEWVTRHASRSTAAPSPPRLPSAGW